MVSEPRQYEVLAVLGAGGFGTVYRARFVGDVGFSKEVALKVLNADMADVDEVAARLRDEARVLGLLRHRAIVHVDRLVLLDGRWTIVMEYVEGVSLSRLIRQGRVPVAAALEIVSEVAAALHVAFARPGPNGQPLHLLHRDIKPSNIQLTPYGEVKVLDFGIARAEFEARESLTRSLSYGTPEYMSPERLDMAADGPEGDIYALGVVLLEMISGRPVGRSSARQDRHEEKIRDALTTLNDVTGVTAAVRALITSMLSWDPSARPTAGDVERIAVRLRNLHHDEPLRTWTETIIPALLAAPVLVEENASALKENLSGATLTERASSDVELRPAASLRPEVPSVPTLEADLRARGDEIEVVLVPLGSSLASTPELAAAPRDTDAGGRSRSRLLIILVLALGAAALGAVALVSFGLWRWGKGEDRADVQAAAELAPMGATPAEPAVEAPEPAPLPAIAPERPPQTPAPTVSSQGTSAGRARIGDEKTGTTQVSVPPVPKASPTATVQVGRSDGATIWVQGRTEILTTGSPVSIPNGNVVVKYRFDDGGVQRISQDVTSGDIWMIQCLASAAICQFKKLDGIDSP